MIGAGPETATPAQPGFSDAERSMATPLDREETPSSPELEGSEESSTQATQEAPAQDLLPTDQAVVEEGDLTEPPTQALKKTLGYDFLLPLEQPQEGEDYPEELYQAAVRRFNLKPETLQDDGSRALLKSKFDADVQLKSQKFREQLDQSEAGEEPGTEAEGEAPAPAGEPLEFEQMFAQALEYAPQAVTPQGAKAFAEATIQGLQALNDAIESGDPKTIEKAQKNYTHSQYAFAILAVQDVLAATRQHRQGEIDSRLAERDKVYSLSAQARELLTQDPQYADVNQMKESKEFKNFLKVYPEISKRQFKGENGKPLNELEQWVERYKFAMQHIRGGKALRPTQAVKAALETGKKQATEAQKRAATGTRLGGRTTGEISSGRQETAKEYVARLEKARLQDNPLAAAAFAGH